MKKVFMIIAAMCMTSIMASAQKTIRVSTDKTDLVMQVSPKGRLYQVYLGDKLKNPSDYNQLKWDVYAASDGAVCQRGHEVYATSGAEDFFEPAVAVTHADGNMTTYLYYQSSEEKAISGGVETIITLKDKVYPLTVKLHYAAYPKENVIKAWSEISHKEKAPVTLWRYSSTMLYFKAGKVIRQLQGGCIIQFILGYVLRFDAVLGSNNRTISSSGVCIIVTHVES